MATRTETLFTVDRDGESFSLPLSALTDDERDQHLAGDYRWLSDEQAAALAATVTPAEFRAHCACWDENLLAAYWARHPTNETLRVLREQMNAATSSGDAGNLVIKLFFSTRAA
jgi:hypothetical protein